METISITGTLRENVGKKFAKQLRKEKKVPCVLYGKGQETIHFSLPQIGLLKLVNSPEVNLIKISINGKEYDAIIKDVQFHPVTDEILHADFYQIFPDRKVKIKIPVKIKGSAIGVTMGGRLHLYKRYLTLKAFPAQLPDFIELDVTHLNIGHSIKVSDVHLDNVDIIERKNDVIVAVKATRLVGEEKPAEEKPVEGVKPEAEAATGEVSKETPKEESPKEEKKK